MELTLFNFLLVFICVCLIAAISPLIIRGLFGILLLFWSLLIAVFYIIVVFVVILFVVSESISEWLDEKSREYEFTEKQKQNKDN